MRLSVGAGLLRLAAMIRLHRVFVPARRAAAREAGLRGFGGVARPGGAVVLAVMLSSAGLFSDICGGSRVAGLFGGPAAAQDFSALARPDPAASRLVDTGQGIALDLALSQPVPWRVRLMDDPPRAVLDFREVDWAGLGRTPFSTSRRVLDLRTGQVQGGWSRLVLELDGPYAVNEAEMRTRRAGGGTGGGIGAGSGARDGTVWGSASGTRSGVGTDPQAAGTALLRLRLVPVDADTFAGLVSDGDPVAWSLPRPAVTEAPRRRQGGEGALLVVLDPGHGGIDPGAEHGGLREADLMLQFARELREALLRAGDFEVVLTRDGDHFVSLDARIALAHSVAADVLVSLHADAVTEGIATGATAYTLSEEASDAASAALAERHDRDMMLAGVDLSGQDDLVARVLMDLARTETAPRAERLAGALVAAIGAQGLALHKVPRRSAAFSVLRSPDIPSVLLELGYLSSSLDRRRLTDANWRAQMVAAIVTALGDWRIADAAEAALLRQ